MRIIVSELRIIRRLPVLLFRAGSDRKELL